MYSSLWANMYQHKWSPNDLPLYNTWKYLYKVVVLSNKSLLIIDKYSHNLLYMSRLIIRKQKETAEAVPFVILHDSIFPIQNF